MKKTLVAVLAFSLFLNATFVAAQAKYDKMLLKAETAYEAGNYNSAYSALTKFKSKVTKKLGSQNAYMPTYYLSHAKYDLASGMVLDFESNVRTAENTSITINQENSLKHGVLLLDVADLYLQNGAYRIAKEYLDKSKKVVETGGFITEALKARLDVSMAEVFMGQGFYNESLELLRSHERFCRQGH